MPVALTQQEVLSKRALSSRAARVILGLAWLVAVGLAANAYRAPQWNLDGVFYAALVRSDLGRGTDSKPVYAKIKKLASPEDYKSVSQGSGYRRRVFRDQAAFDMQLPFYTSKVLYRGASAAISKVGVSAVRAPYVVSTISFALIALLLPWWAMRAGARPVLAYGAALVWLIAAQVVESVGLGSPDMLGALTLSLGACALVGASRPNLATASFVAAALARPDLCIVGVVVFLGTRTSLRAWFWDGVRAGVIGGAAVIATFATGSYTWPVVMRHTFIGIIKKSTLHQGLTLDEYLTALDKGLKGAFADHPAGYAPFLAVSCGVIVLHVWRARQVSLNCRLLLAIWLGTGLRLLAFPMLADRMLLPAYACTIALAAALASELYQSFAAGPVGSRVSVAAER